MRVLVVNAGSSSLKLRLLDGDDELDAARDLALEHGNIDEQQLADALAGIDRPDAIGHRIVHGGRRYREAVRIDDRVVAALRELTDLAPLHQPKSLAALDAVTRLLPDVPAVACFDTAFHATLPPAAATYALPAAWRERWDLHRYGFHGLSTHTPRGAPPSSPAPRGWSPAISERAHHSPPSAMGARSTPRWGSRRSTGW